MRAALRSLLLWMLRMLDAYEGAGRMHNLRDTRVVNRQKVPTRFDPHRLPKDPE